MFSAASLRRLLRTPRAVVGLAIILGVTLAAAAGPVAVELRPYTDRRTYPGTSHSGIFWAPTTSGATC